MTVVVIVVIVAVVAVAAWWWMSRSGGLSPTPTPSPVSGTQSEELKDLGGINVNESLDAQFQQIDQDLNSI